MDHMQETVYSCNYKLSCDAMILIPAITASFRVIAFA